ncbi:hypothetical protein EDD16DRAFT_1733644 [Pisolithus croceorrhizus]|nr:hypothetical protein EDD16DRAFT_1733644 [Pisolithus croceorrhizus]
MHYVEGSSAEKFLVIAIWCVMTHSVKPTQAKSGFLIQYMCRSIINYGVPTSLAYTVWTLSASPILNVCVISAVQLYFAHAIHSLCRPQVRWLVTAPIILLILVHFGFDMVTVATTYSKRSRHYPRNTDFVCRFVNIDVSELQGTRFYSVIPAAAATALAEILIAVSLCILLYDSGSGFASSGTKRLLNTLIIYAVNRCLLNLLVTIAALATAPSLNSQKRLRPQDSKTESLADERVSAIHFANLPRVPGDGERPKDEVTRVDVHEMVIDIGADACLDKATTLQRDETV